FRVVILELRLPLFRSAASNELGRAAVRQSLVLHRAGQRTHADARSPADVSRDGTDGHHQLSVRSVSPARHRLRIREPRSVLSDSADDGGRYYELSLRETPRQLPGR